MRIYLREFETGPEGATIVTGKRGGRSFDCEDREQYADWFKARPRTVKAHLTGQVDEVAAKRKANTDKPAGAEESTKDRKNRLAREAYARNKAAG